MMTKFKTCLHSHIALLLTLFSLSLVSCEKLEVPEEEDNPKDEVKEDALIYTVNDILQQTYTQENTKDVYLEGYIVGFIEGSSIEQAIFGNGSIESNILLAAKPTEEDPTLCIPVQLSTSPNNCRQTRDALNLSDHPDMLHQHIRLCGDIASYMGVKGLLHAHAHTLLPDDDEEEPDTPEEPEEPDTPEEPETPENPDTPEIPDIPESPTPTRKDTIDYVESRWHSEEPPFTIADIKTYIPAYFEYKRSQAGILPDKMQGCYVRGYIVGYISKGKTLSKTSFSATNAVESNIVLADFPDEIDPNRCIAVELPNSSQGQKMTREALNLATHPENLHKEVIILGDIHYSYMGSYGLKNARAYSFPTPSSTP